MAVQEQIPYIKYVGNGTTKSFATTFVCESRDQLRVFLDGEESLLGWDYKDGLVTFYEAPILDTFIELKRATKLKRAVTYQSYNNTLNCNALNFDFDRVWYALQDINLSFSHQGESVNYAVNTADKALKISNEANSTSGKALVQANKTNSRLDVVLKDDHVDAAKVITTNGKTQEELNSSARLISTGGTGATTAKSARDNLDVYSKDQVHALVVGVDGGGTGATTSAQARKNLSVPSISEVSKQVEEAKPPLATEKIAGLVKIGENLKIKDGVLSAESQVEQATEDEPGKAKIATTETVKEGQNDTDFVTPLKLDQVLKEQSKKREWHNVAGVKAANTWYTNTSGFDIDISLTWLYGSVCIITLRKIGETQELEFLAMDVASSGRIRVHNYLSIPHGYEYKVNGFSTWMELRG